MKHRSDLARLDNTLSKIKNPPGKKYKLKEVTVTAKGPKANERLLAAAQDRLGTEEWRSPSSETTRFPKIKKGINKIKSAFGREQYNEKGQTKSDTCVSFVGGVCQKSNVAFPQTQNNRDLVQTFQNDGRGKFVEKKRKNRLWAKKGDIVIFSDKNRTHEADWRGKGEGGRPFHIGIKSGRNKYISSAGGDVVEKKIHRKDTRRYDKTFYKPTNLYK
jgi:hypothetical protein